MDAFKSLVSPLIGTAASNSVIDGMKLVVLGGAVETARRVSGSAWYVFVQLYSSCLVSHAHPHTRRNSFVNCMPSLRHEIFLGAGY